MLVGMYASASGMLAEAARHDAIANNLANVSTMGFKGDTPVISAHPTQMLHRLSDNLMGLDGKLLDMAPAVAVRGEGAIVDAILPRMTQGVLTSTDNPTDFALRGEGFFVVDTARGKRYTRQGNFAVDGRGRLVTQSGDPVLTSTGAQILVGNRRLEVMADGTFRLDGEETGRLAVSQPEDRSAMYKEGEGLFAAAAGTRFKRAGADVVQGSLERSNVNAVLEMTEMLEALRAYEANQRAIVAQDETLNTLISQVGRFA